MKKLSLVQILALVAVSSALVSCGGSSRGDAGTNSSSSATAAAKSPAAAAPFSPTEGGFKVSFPSGYGSPKQKQNEQTRWVSYTSQGPTNNACAVSYLAFSEAISSKMDSPEKLQRVAEALRDESLKGLEAGGATALNDREDKFDVQGNPGVSVHGTSVSQEATVYFRVDNVVTKKRGYRIACFSAEKETFDKPEMQAFFKSFQLTE